MARGILFLVVGPSGAGKDTLIAGAREKLKQRADIVFTPRYVTRQTPPDGEDELPIGKDAFEAQRKAGDFLLSWTAHGLGYGIPGTVDQDLKAGRAVVANVSRTVIERARSDFPPVRVLYVTATPEALGKRLRARGRETPAEIEERLAGMAAYLVEGPDVVVIKNDGSVAEGIAAFAAAIENALA